MLPWKRASLVLGGRSYRKTQRRKHGGQTTFRGSQGPERHPIGGYVHYSARGTHDQRFRADSSQEFRQRSQEIRLWIGEGDATI